MVRALMTAEMRPAARCAGRIRVPGDKSISHRYAMLAALADGVSRITDYSLGADCTSTLVCLRALGVPLERLPDAVVITGRGLRGLTAADRPLDAENSGTSMRLLAGIVAAHPFRTEITGDESLSRRPMRRVITPLERMGARIASHEGRPPLTIHGTNLRGIAYQPEIPSAQVKSAVLLAGLQADGETTVVEPVPTRDHTERALDAFGVGVRREEDRITVRGGSRLRARDLTVPGDISGAAFWAVLAAATPDSDVTIEGVGLNPTRTGILDVLTRAGARIDTTRREDAAGEPTGDLHITSGSLRSFAIAPDEVPGVIDEIPALATLGCLLPRGCTMEVRGAAELRVKESDRITALAEGLRALGADIEEYPDGFKITARPLRGGAAHAYGDHRLGMAFVIAACRAETPSSVTGVDAIGVSYRNFFETLATLIGEGDDR